MKLIPFTAIEAKLTAAQRKRVSDDVRGMRAEMLLVGLWQHSGRPQRALAASLGVKHPTAARAKAFDLLEVSTLERIMRSFGGKLRLTVTMKTGEEWPLPIPAGKHAAAPQRKAITAKASGKRGRSSTSRAA